MCNEEREPNPPPSRRTPGKRSSRGSARHGGRPQAARVRDWPAAAPSPVSLQIYQKFNNGSWLPKTCARGRPTGRAEEERWARRSRRGGAVARARATAGSRRRTRATWRWRSTRTPASSTARSASTTDARTSARGRASHPRVGPRGSGRTRAVGSDPCARGTSVASVGKRGGGLGEFGLDRRDGERDGRIARRRARGTRGGRRARARAPHHTRGVREEDGAGGTEQGEGASRGVEAAGGGKGGALPEKVGDGGARGKAFFAVVRGVCLARRPRRDSNLRPPRLREPPTPAALAGLNPRPRSVRPPSYRAVNVDGRPRAGFVQVKVFRDGNSLFHCARLGEIVCRRASEAHPRAGCVGR